MGVVTILYAKLLTEADPVIMAIVYFSMFSIAKGITTGYFTPAGSLAAWSIGRTETHDFIKNLIAQFLGVIAVSITFIPTKAYIDHI